MVIAGWVAFTGCNPPEQVEVLATTSVVADAARHILPEDIGVVALMHSNIDPHSYKPVESDVQKLQSAKVVLHNGLHLEGKMTDILEKLGRQKPVHAMSEGLQEQELISVGPGTHDPHIWFDLQIWAKCVADLAQFLAEQYPSRAQEIMDNADQYSAELLEAHQTFLMELASVDSSDRAFVTAHDAFSYFGRAYGLEVHGLQGISTVAEFGIKDLSALAQFIVDQKLKTVFVETSVNPRSMEALREAVQQKGGQVEIGEPLFSDALGDQGTPEATLIGAFKHNTHQILKSFK